MENTHKKLSDDFLSRRSKFREVSSRYLHTISSSPHNRIEFVSTSSPNAAGSQISRQSNSILSTDSRKHRSHDSGLLRKLWPSAAGKSSKHDSLGKHLDEEREKDFTNSNQNSLLNRQKSSVFNRFEGSDKNVSSSKENHKPFFGGSMRYTGNFKSRGRSSPSSIVDDNNLMIPGRLSVDETALRQRSFGGRSEDCENHDSGSGSGSEISDFGSNTSLGSPYIGRSSPVSYMSPTVSSSFRKLSKEVSSKHINEKHRRGTSDSNIVSQKVHDNSLTNKVKKVNWITTASRWGSSPRRSPPQQSFQKPSSHSLTHSNSKPPTSPSKGKLPPTSPNRVKGVGSFISLGLDLFKKPYPSSSGGVTVISGPSTVAESVHQLRLLHNRLVQWRYTNARCEIMNKNITTQTEKNLLCAYDALLKVQHSVLQEKVQLEKEKLEIKLNYILCSQIKPLESWSHSEKQHLSAVSMITDSLHSVVCRIPLIEGAVVETESASFALRYASDLAASIESILSSFSPEVDKTAVVLAELAEIAAQEKSMLEECLELSRFVSKLEIGEWSLKCQVLQLQHQQQQQQQISV